MLEKQMDVGGISTVLREMSNNDMKKTNAMRPTPGTDTHK